jgi:hypothetical protein
VLAHARNELCEIQHNCVYVEPQVMLSARFADSVFPAQSEISSEAAQHKRSPFTAAPLSPTLLVLGTRRSLATRAATAASSWPNACGIRPSRHKTPTHRPTTPIFNVVWNLDCGDPLGPPAAAGYVEDAGASRCSYAGQTWPAERRLNITVGST